MFGSHRTLSHLQHTCRGAPALSAAPLGSASSLQRDSNVATCSRVRLQRNITATFQSNRVDKGSCRQSAASVKQQNGSRCNISCMASSSGSAGTIRREVLNRSQRLKLDPDDDRNFYEMPRYVNHVDDHFIQSVTALYRQRIPRDGAVLDLMSSHVSHLPRDNSYSKVIGHGMNAMELRRNPQLTTWFVRNLNLEPSGWAMADNSVDAVTCCVSVQYLQYPEKVVAEIYRVLKPGGIAIFSFSNRMFFTKAVRGWTDNTEYGRISLVKQYFQSVDGFTTPEEVEEVDTSQEQPQGLAAFVSKLQGFSQNDPFYAVLAYKDFKPSAV